MLSGGRVHTLRIDMEVQLSTNSNIYTGTIITLMLTIWFIFFVIFVFGSVRVSPMADHLRSCTYWVVNDLIIIIVWRWRKNNNLKRAVVSITCIWDWMMIGLTQSRIKRIKKNLKNSKKKSRTDTVSRNPQWTNTMNHAI